MEKLRGVQLLIVAAVTCLVAGQALAVPTIYNTGVDDGGAALPSGTVDTHYTVNGGDAVATVRHPAWVAAPAGSMWIGSELSSVTVPTDVPYIYATTFELEPLEGTIVSLSGSWSVDNTGEIWLNGAFTGISLDTELSYTSLHNFVITDGFFEGLNTLEFRTNNLPNEVGANPNALLVAGLVVTQNPVIPAPGAIVLASLGTCVIGFIRRKGIL